MAQKRTRLPREAYRKGWGKELRTPYFLMKGRKNGGEAARVGVVTGLAVGKTAVRRNFWKRQAREALSKSVRGGNDVLIILSPKVNTLTKKEFVDAAARAAARISAAV